MGLNLIDGENQSAGGGGNRSRYLGQLPGQFIRIHTLGRFGIQIDGQVLPAEKMRQQKPIELLQALIAHGGRGVSKELLSASLWPDMDGDEAANSYDVTLHRLRKLLQHNNVLIATDGRLTLNAETAWVDVWVFERILNQIDRLLMLPSSKAVTERLFRLLTQAMTFYQGGFLARETPKSWSLSIRERVRSMLLRNTLRVAEQAEINRQLTSASYLYLKGIEIDPLYEQFYQRLMACYRDQGRAAEALAIFQRCHSNLTSGLGIGPSPETIKVRDSLK